MYFRKRTTIAALLVAAAVSCKKTQTAELVLARVISLGGQVSAGGAPLAQGARLTSGAHIVTGSDSFCILALRNQTTVKIKAQSSFKLGQDENIARVDTGSILVKARTDQEKKLQVLTPTAVASVRGTEFSVAVAADGSTGLSVVEGRVAQRVRVMALEDLPDDLVLKNKALSGVVDALEEKERIIPAGESAEVPKSAVERIVEKSPELKQVLESPAVKALQGKTDVTLAEIEAASAALSQALPAEKTETITNDIIAEIIASSEALPPAEKLDDAEIKAAEEEFKEVREVQASQPQDFEESLKNEQDSRVEKETEAAEKARAAAEKQALAEKEAGVARQAESERALREAGEVRRQEAMRQQALALAQQRQYVEPAVPPADPAPVPEKTVLEKATAEERPVEKIREEKAAIDPEFNDAVYLKDGRVLTGVRAEVGEDSIEIREKDGDTERIPKTEVLRFVPGG